MLTANWTFSVSMLMVDRIHSCLYGNGESGNSKSDMTGILFQPQMNKSSKCHRPSTDSLMTIAWRHRLDPRDCSASVNTHNVHLSSKDQDGFHARNIEFPRLTKQNRLLRITHGRKGQSYLGPTQPKQTVSTRISPGRKGQCYLGSRVCFAGLGRFFF